MYVIRKNIGCSFHFGNILKSTFLGLYLKQNNNNNKNNNQENHCELLKNHAIRTPLILATPFLCPPNQWRTECVQFKSYSHETKNMSRIFEDDWNPPCFCKAFGQDRQDKNENTCNCYKSCKEVSWVGGIGALKKGKNECGEICATLERWWMKKWGN